MNLQKQLDHLAQHSSYLTEDQVEEYATSILEDMQTSGEGFGHAYYFLNNLAKIIECVQKDLSHASMHYAAKANAPIVVEKVGNSKKLYQRR